MVSVDHFAHELRTQLRNAAAQGATTIVITSGDFCKKNSHRQRFDPSVLRGDAGRGETRRRCPRFRQRCRNDGPIDRRSYRPSPEAAATAATNG
jgi:hypothetical protein